MLNETFETSFKTFLKHVVLFQDLQEEGGGSQLSAWMICFGVFPIVDEEDSTNGSRLESFYHNLLDVLIK